MATFTQYGDGSYRFGITDNTGVIDGMALETISFDKTPEFEAEAKGDDGTVKSIVRGPDKFAFTATGFLHDKDLFDAVGDFEFDGQFYIINKKSISESNQDYNKCEISGIGHINIQSVAT